MASLVKTKKSEKRIRFVTETDRLFYRLDREDMWRAQDKKCFHCKKSITKEQATFDHVTPLSKRNKYHTVQNCVVSCAKCNHTKGAELDFEPEEWQLMLQEGLKRLDRRVRLAEYNIGKYVGTEDPKGSFNKWERYWEKQGRFKK